MWALFAATLVPVIALARWRGWSPNRCESVRVLVAASLCQPLVATLLAFSGDLAAISALSSLLAAGNAFGQPVEFALIPDVARSRPVTEATGVLEAARYASFAAGPAFVAGLAAVGPRPTLLFNPASFLAIADAAGAMRARRPPRCGSAAGEPSDEPDHKPPRQPTSWRLAVRAHGGSRQPGGARLPGFRRSRHPRGGQ